ncbi:MAG: penicillin acylase family protein, partial [Catenulispora sp.]|nr:penicillin acylase family protein [Catenulispora sp.]
MQTDHDEFEEQPADPDAAPVEDASEPDDSRSRSEHRPRRPRRPRRRFRKLKIASGITAVLLVLLAGAGVWWLNSSLHASYPQTTGTLRVPGLDAKVEVDRNAQGVPQVYASTSHDLFFAQGYVQAQDRFWQMDVYRHITAGRLAEMFGSGQVDTDKFIRTMGWRAVAEQEYSALNADTKAYLTSYSAGVNAYLKDHKGSKASVEYAV